MSLYDVVHEGERKTEPRARERRLEPTGDWAGEPRTIVSHGDARLAIDEARVDGHVGPRKPDGVAHELSDSRADPRHVGHDEARLLAGGDADLYVSPGLELLGVAGRRGYELPQIGCRLRSALGVTFEVRGSLQPIRGPKLSAGGHAAPSRRRA